MMNTLSERAEELARMHHPVLLDAVHAVLASHPPFAWWKDGRLVLDADGVARAVLARKSWTERDILTLPARGTASSCTLHMDPSARDATHQRVRQIYDQLHRHYDAAAATRELSPQSLTSAHCGDARQDSPFGQLYPDGSGELRGPARRTERRRLTFRPPATTPRPPPLMRWHKLTLTVRVPPDTPRLLAKAIRTYYETAPPGLALGAADPDELAALVDQQAADPQSDLALLTQALDLETVGQLKKEALLCYLGFLDEQLEPTDRDRPLLQDLIRRLRLLQAYVRRLDLPDTTYQVDYEGVT
jgi:hypothetical protein